MFTFLVFFLERHGHGPHVHDSQSHVRVADVRNDLRVLATDAQEDLLHLLTRSLVVKGLAEPRQLVPRPWKDRVRPPVNHLVEHREPVLERLNRHVLPRALGVLDVLVTNAVFHLFLDKGLRFGRQLLQLHLAGPLQCGVAFCEG